MKKLCAIFLLFAAICFEAGCSAPGSTEINRPPPDVNGVRYLLLTTSFNPLNEVTFASAAYSDSTVQGFGAGVFITCNSATIIDTRQTTGEPDTGTFIGVSSSYTWSYQGPDTSFAFTMSAPGNQFEITEPTEDEELDPFEGDSLPIMYEPIGPCSSLTVRFTGFEENNDIEDTVKPTIHFNPFTGVINPISLSIFNQLDFGGQGTISIIKVSDSAFSIPSIHSIIVKDSSASEPSLVEWE